SVVAADTGRGIENVPIGVYGPAHPNGRGVGVQSVRTNARGEFSVRVPPGEQYLYIMAGGTFGGYVVPDQSGKDVTVEEGQSSDVVWKLSKATAGRKGKVTGPDGQPVAGAQIFVEDDRPFFGNSLRSGSDGTF